MIPHFYKSIHGYFTFPDFYEWAVSQMPKDGARAVEVGVHSGQSAAFLGVEMANHLTNWHLDLVDNGMNVAHVEASLKPIFDINESGIELHRHNSVDVADTFRDKVLDLVYIDANHTYDDVLADVYAWLPKLRDGGILAGHDFTTEIPDVIRAVTDRFARYEIFRGIQYQNSGKYFPTWMVRV